MRVPKKQANPIDIQVGNRVRIRRMLIGMSQERLGDLLGLTFQQVQKYEKGMNRISASRLQTICKILGVQISFFFEGGDILPSDTTNDEPERGGIAPYLKSREAVALNTNFLAIKDAGKRRALVKLVEALAEMYGNDRPDDLVNTD